MLNNGVTISVSSEVKVKVKGTPDTCHPVLHSWLNTSHHFSLYTNYYVHIHIHATHPQAICIHTHMYTL